MSATQKKDLVVVGGGIVGVSVAYELQKSGRQVVLIDRAEPGLGCSQANAGWITPCFAMPLPQPGMFWKSIGWLLDPMSPLYIKPSLDPLLVRWLWHFSRSMNQRKFERSVQVLAGLSKYSLDFYSSFSKSRPELGFEKQGLLLVSSTDEGMKYARHEMQTMARHGIAGKLMSQEELLNFEPALRPLVRGGVYFPDEAHAEPYKMVQSLAAEFVKLGGEILTGHEVYDFTVAENKIQSVKTTKRIFSAELFVMATGSWSAQMARQLKLNVPVLGGKGYSMSVTTQHLKPQRPIMIVDSKIAVTPFAESVRLAGTLELVNQDFSITSKRVQSIWQGAQEYLHLQGVSEPTNLWRGLRPCTPDGVPMIGFSKKYQNLFLCTGHQMLGFQSAPGSARLSADLILGRTPVVDPECFLADRFG